MTTHLTLHLKTLPPATRSRTRPGRLSRYLPLLIILAVQAAVAALTLHNTAFQDEALYLYAGSQLFHALTGGPPPTQDYATYFSGYPYLYPLLAGMLSALGGLEAVRWFSTLCMLVVTVCVYAVTRRCFHEASAYAAATLFAFQGATLFLSRLATFDALCLALLALATVLAVQVSSARDPAGAVILGPLLLLAIGVKYAALLFVPGIIAVMMLRTYQQQGWARMLVHAVLTVVGAALIGVPAFRVMNHDFLVGISATTTQRTAIIRTPTEALLTIIVSLGGLMWLLGVLGLALSSRRQRLLVLTFLLLSALAPIYHLYTGELVSLQKHVGFGLFFVAPLAGYALATMVGGSDPVRLNRRWVAGLALSLVVIMVGINASSWYYSAWPNSQQMVTAMRTQTHAVTDRCLCEDVEVVRYYLSDVTADFQYTGLDYFEYTDMQGHRYAGAPAYTAAIADEYFDLVELSFTHATLAPMLQAALQANPHYQLIARIPYTDSYGTNYYSIWRKRGT